MTNINLLIQEANNLAELAKESFRLRCENVDFSFHSAFKDYLTQYYDYISDIHNLDSNYIAAFAEKVALEIIKLEEYLEAIDSNTDLNEATDGKLYKEFREINERYIMLKFQLDGLLNMI